MQIYLIVNESEHDWDCNLAHVIAANNVKEVRLIAIKHVVAEMASVWDSAKVYKVGIYTGKKRTAHVILTENKGA